MTGAVVVGGLITGLSTARALGSHGIPVAAIVPTREDLSHYSRFVQECHVVDFCSQPEALLDVLHARAGPWRDRVLLPTGDEALGVLSRNRERLEPSYRVATPPWHVTRTLLHKDLTYDVARRVGVDLPRVYGPATLEIARTADISFPALVKPVESRPFVRRFGVKLFVARDRPELLGHVRTVGSSGIRAEIVDLIPGREGEVFYTVYIDRTRSVRAVSGARKVRKSPPFFGVSRVTEMARLDALREPTIELLRAIGHHGIASTEYKLDPRDGRYRLMEINGRLFTHQALYRRAGVNYPLLAWREAALGDAGDVTCNGWEGVWINLLDDIYYGTFFRRLEGLTVREYVDAYRRPKVEAVRSAADPRPFFAHIRQAARKAMAAAASRQARAALARRVQRMP